MLMMFFLIISFINFVPAKGKISSNRAENAIPTYRGNERKVERMNSRVNNDGTFESEGAETSLGPKQIIKQKRHPNPTSILGQLMDIVVPKANSQTVQSKQEYFDEAGSPGAGPENSETSKTRRLADSSKPSDRRRLKGSGQHRVENDRPDLSGDQVSSKEQYESQNEVISNKLSSSNEIMNHRRQSHYVEPVVTARQGTFQEAENSVFEQKRRHANKKRSEPLTFSEPVGYRKLDESVVTKPPNKKKKQQSSDLFGDLFKSVGGLLGGGSAKPKKEKSGKKIRIKQSENDDSKSPRGSKRTTPPPAKPSKAPPTKPSQSKVPAKLIGSILTGLNLFGDKKSSQKSKDEPGMKRKSKIAGEPINKSEQKGPDKQATNNSLEQLHNFKLVNLNQPVLTENQDALTTLNQLDDQRRSDFSDDNRDFGPQQRKLSDSGGHFDDDEHDEPVVGMRGYRDHEETEGGKKRVVLIIPVPKGLGGNMKQYQGIMSFLSQVLPQVFSAT